MSENRGQQQQPMTTNAIPSLMSITTPPGPSSQVFSIPTNNHPTLFTPQFLSNTPMGGGGAASILQRAAQPPALFMTPSGQMFVTNPVQSSPTVLPSFLNNTYLLPQLHMSSHQPANLAFPYGVIATPSTPSSQPTSLSLGSSLQSTALIPSIPVICTSNMHSTTMSAPRQHISPVSAAEQLPFSGNLLKSPSSLTLPSEPLTEHSSLASSSIDSDAPSVIMSTKAHSLTAHRQGQLYPRQQVTTSDALKKLLTGDQTSTCTTDPLKEQLEGEEDLILVHRCFSASMQSKHLHCEVLPSQGNLKWLQVRQKAFHIDSDLGPVMVARILVSSNRIVKLQILFPVYKTVSTKVFVEEETERILSELSLDHVICPGLPNYSDKYSVLGYHPSHVRIVETCSETRYDHEDCPIWHVPTGTFTKRDRTAQKMCKQCKYLQNSVVRLATKACEVDPVERESWTDPSSNRPLAYMSAADREERYRKLRQERNQMLVKLRNYEERLGIGKRVYMYIHIYMYVYIHCTHSYCILGQIRACEAKRGSQNVPFLKYFKDT